MSNTNKDERLASKTPEGAFLQVLEKEFQFSRRVSDELLNVTKEILLGHTKSTEIRPGQVRMVVASLKAPFGPPLADIDKVVVTLTLDDGVEDIHVKRQEGSTALRRGRILRILEEALEQGGVLTQEDLARILNVNERTIRRDVRALKAAGHLVHTRGHLKGVGRGQTHKVRIIELWLDREGYEKIARWVHHTPQAIKRYVNTFIRMVILHEKGTAIEEIAFLTKTSSRLVKDYLAVYEASMQVSHRQEKLQEVLDRVQTWQKVALAPHKKGGKTL